MCGFADLWVTLLRYSGGWQLDYAISICKSISIEENLDGGEVYTIYFPRVNRFSEGKEDGKLSLLAFHGSK